MGMRSGRRIVKQQANAAPAKRTASQRLAILLVVGESGGDDARAELEAAGCDVRVAELVGDLDGAARGIVARAEKARLIVCDCAGDDGCERAFFLCRASGERAVVLFAVGEGVECEPLEVLVAALRKGLSSSRIALLSDRVDERERPSGGARRSPPSAGRTAQIAAVLRGIAERAAWPARANFYV